MGKEASLVETLWGDTIHFLFAIHSISCALWKSLPSLTQPVSTPNHNDGLLFITFIYTVYIFSYEYIYLYDYMYWQNKRCTASEKVS